MPHPTSVPPEFVEAGMTYRQLDYWTKRGYLRPLGGGGPGVGSYRRWPQAEIEVGCRMMTLVRGGYTPAAAARLARHGVVDHQQEVRVTA